jgi:hypothetical protein
MGDGEAIGNYPDDGLVYHFSGLRETETVGPEMVILTGER